MSAWSDSPWCFVYQGQGKEKYISLVSIQIGHGKYTLLLGKIVYISRFMMLINLSSSVAFVFNPPGKR